MDQLVLAEISSQNVMEAIMVLFMIGVFAVMLGVVYFIAKTAKDAAKETAQAVKSGDWLSLVPENSWPLVLIGLVALVAWILSLKN